MARKQSMLAEGWWDYTTLSHKVFEAALKSHKSKSAVEIDYQMAPVAY